MYPSGRSESTPPASPVPWRVLIIVCDYTVLRVAIGAVGGAVVAAAVLVPPA
jgi:hypothetical protein